MIPLWNRPVYTARIRKCLGHTPFLSSGHSGASVFSKQDGSRSFSCSKHEQRSRLSRLWAPSGGISATSNEDAHSKLMRAGFLRQAYLGIYHMLPLGLRVQRKVERLIDKHMCRLGASRLDLSSISSEHLWEKSGRLKKVNSELFRFKDRRDNGYLLSPTHEEEITELVAGSVKSYKELPIRLYQISRKYRDELRPRHGLLRSREFIMKDLYTFDYNASLALETYDQVRRAYAALFDELKIPYLIAEADSGDIGGSMSHEFHFITPKGEDYVISCRNCNYVANMELAQSPVSSQYECQDGLPWAFTALEDLTQLAKTSSARRFSVWRGVSRDRSTLINVWHALTSDIPNSISMAALQSEVNIHAIKRIVPELDPGVENATALWMQRNKVLPNPSQDEPIIPPRIINLIDCRLPSSVLDFATSGQLKYPLWPEAHVIPAFKVISSVTSRDPSGNGRINLMRIRDGDTCPRCGTSQLKVDMAIELGHTFLLGTRYSEPLDAYVTVPAGRIEAEHPSNSNMAWASQSRVPMQMGCHGIGASRMIGAVAETLADDKGLNWPRAIAPFEVVIVPVLGFELDAANVYDAVAVESRNPQDFTYDVLDVVLDDRTHPFGWKMRDADLNGYPVIVVVGKSWATHRTCEVQSRRLGICEKVPLENLLPFIRSLLAKL